MWFSKDYIYSKSVLYNDYIIVQFHGILSFQFLTGDCVGLTILTMKVNYDLFACFFFCFSAIRWIYIGYLKQLGTQ